MSLTATGWRLFVDLIDTGGNTTSRTFDLVATDDAGDMTDVTTAVTAILSAITGASDAVVKAYNIGKVFVESALTLPTAAEVENNLQVSAKIAGHPNKSAVFDIPAPKATLFQQTTGPGWNLADFADPLLSAYVNLFTTTGVAYISDGEQITAQDIRGKRIHKKSNKG